MKTIGIVVVAFLTATAAGPLVTKIDVQANQVRSQVVEALYVTVREARFERDVRALAWAVALGAAFGIANGSQFRETRLLGAMLGAFGGIINATLVTSGIFFEALVMAT